MNPLRIALISAALAASPGAAWAFDCDANTTQTFDLRGISLIFDGTEGFSSQATRAECSTSADITLNGTVAPLPPGVVAVYSADYRGFLDEESSGRMRVVNRGRTSGTTVVATDEPVDGIFYSDYAGSNASGTGIDSDIILDLLYGYDSESYFGLDSIDYYELARANVSDLVASAGDLSAARTGVVTQLNGTLDLLGGAGRPFDAEDGIDFVGGIGSVTLGLQGRKTLTDELTLHGGIAYIDQHATNSSASGVAGTLGLRYAPHLGEGMRPFADVGVKAAPGMGLTLSRTYVTNQGSSTVSGQTTGTFLGAYVTGGVLVAPDLDNDIVFSATYARDALSTAAYDETLNGSNLFAASAPAQTGVFNTVKAGAAWTTRPLDNVEVTLHGAVGATMAESAVATNIAFVGAATSGAVSEAFVEYGVRAATEFSPGMQAGLFAHATTGAVSGTHAQIGGDLRVKF